MMFFMKRKGKFLRSVNIFDDVIEVSSECPVQCSKKGVLFVKPLKKKE